MRITKLCRWGVLHFYPKTVVVAAVVLDFVATVVVVDVVAAVVLDFVAAYFVAVVVVVDVVVAQ